MTSADNWRHRVWTPLRDAAGFPNLHFHDLRHTHASQLLAAGVQVEIVSERLGHKSPRTTQMIYAHAMPNQQPAALDALRARRRRRGA